MRQTAVEWLQDCLTVHFSEIAHQIKFTGLFEKAKRLENELKIEMFDKGFDSVEQLNDDYAIEFVEWFWINKDKFYKGERDYYLEFNQILEIYKKEKGL